MLNKTPKIKKKSSCSLILSITFLQNRKHSHLINFFNTYFINSLLSPTTFISFLLKVHILVQQLLLKKGSYYLNSEKILHKIKSVFFTF